MIVLANVHSIMSNISAILIIDVWRHPIAEKEVFTKVK
jgi:hypothetical protein